MMIRSVLVLALLYCGLLAKADEPAFLDRYRSQAVEKWEGAMREFEKRNREETHPDDAVLFVGSSSIRLWRTIAEDLTPYAAIQRGFGGSKFSDVAVFADRIITPHRFRAVVIFVANDIRGKEDDKNPGEIARLFSYVRERIRNHNPKAPVFFIAITPTGSRWDSWEQSKEANSAIREVCRETEDTYFIGTESLFLGADGQPRAELFIKDRLHLHPDGYKLWAAAIKSHLDTVFDGAGGD